MLGSKMLNNSHGTKLWGGRGRDERNMTGEGKKKWNSRRRIWLGIEFEWSKFKLQLGSKFGRTKSSNKLMIRDKVRVRTVLEFSWISIWQVQLDQIRQRFFYSSLIFVEPLLTAPGKPSSKKWHKNANCSFDKVYQS